MKLYIFDREKDDILKDDGEKISFNSNEEVYTYLSKDCQFTDSWIKDNFYILRSQKILLVEDLKIPYLINTNNFKIGDKVSHPEIYLGNEVFEVVGIRENELELKGDWSGGTHAVCQVGWFKKEGCFLADSKPPINGMAL